MGGMHFEGADLGAVWILFIVYDLFCFVLFWMTGLGMAYITVSLGYKGLLSLGVGQDRRMRDTTFLFCL
jgi:hypothetical protein